MHVCIMLSALGDATKLLSGVLTLISFWNLDFFRHVLPPFCISSRLTDLDVLRLDCISAFYPLFLALLTLVLIELHARNFCPLVTSSGNQTTNTLPTVEESWILNHLWLLHWQLSCLWHSVKSWYCTTQHPIISATNIWGEVCTIPAFRVTLQPSM